MGSKEKIEKRSRVKPFVKYVNYNHLVPTRFTVAGEFTTGDKELKHYVSEEKMATAESRKASRRSLRTSSRTGSLTLMTATINNPTLTSSSRSSDSECIYTTTWQNCHCMAPSDQ